ncbi:putative cellulase [Anaeromyces robustus]|uniref:Glucanase n=1 Tax=Anaeromyces robustus TaxID=1754192 RepID=A0A1Y1WWL4_9FUNG|nr:putative cellulase [Anaeromyces robustus]|eukprot:ORX77524.1 putative cellulase [Anaeromyces robustus]
MKTVFALAAIAALASKVSAASCWANRLGYQCCKGNTVVYTDSDGKWGVENGNWCGIVDGTQQNATCWSQPLGYPCCQSTSDVIYTDSDGDWGVENGNWCGIIKGGSTGGGTGGGSTTPGEQYTISGNPFSGVEFYINPYYVEEVDNAIAQMTDSSLKAKAEKMKTYPNAIWLDNIKNMQSWLQPNLEKALAQQSGSKKVLTVFVVYDLPGRDCHAMASNGELLANDSDAQRYKTEYIDVIEEQLKKYKSQPIVLIIEPDSLANMVTNIETTPACAESQDYYFDGHAYLLKKFGVLQHVAMYLDIGHAFWLGWDDNREKAAKVYKKVIDSGSPGKVRGFVDNVANYTPWEDPTLSRGPDTEWNPCPDEKRYLEAMYKDFTSAGIKSVYFVSDSSRNGHKTDRKHPGEWCNQTGVGIGARPQANPISGMDYLDAFYWIKPLGESDGTSDESAERYDGYCGHDTAMKPAPEAGQWFQAHFEQGLENANPPL